MTKSAVPSEPMLANIRVVLVETSHPGNIGAAARAMKNMGLRSLRLVRPNIFPSARATARASGADDLLRNAKVYDQLEKAVGDTKLVIGASARDRTIQWPQLSPADCAAKIFSAHGEAAIVFGREHSGLTNEELEQCRYLLRIPTYPEFASLNVASAVQVITYELRRYWLKNHALPPTAESLESIALAQDMAGFYTHLEQTLIDLNFLDPSHPRLLMRRLHRLFNRAELTVTEINILRGILSAAQKAVKNTELSG